MAIEIVDSPINNGGSFHSYVCLPEGKSTSPCQQPPSVSPRNSIASWWSAWERRGVTMSGAQKRRETKQQKWGGGFTCKDWDFTLKD